MRLRLDSPLRQLLFAAACLVAFCWYGFAITRNYLASRAAASLTLAGLQRAVALQPHNAEYRDLLGNNLLAAQQDISAAEASYRAAVRLNPFVSRYWLDLAGAWQVTGNSEGQRHALQRAVAADPMNPDVAWEAANFYLVQKSLPAALAELRAVIAGDPGSVRPALLLAWQSTHDLAQILAWAVPPTAAAHAALLQILIDAGETQAAAQAWSHWLRLRQPFPPQLAFPYVDYLLAHRQAEEAAAAWQQMSAFIPALADHTTSGNLVVNGGFEDDLLHGGLDWRLTANPLASLALDTTQFHSGTRSLALSFTGNSGSEAGILQWVPVRPNTTYEFSAYLRSDELLSASGPRLGVYDAYSNTLYLLSDEIIGSVPWREVKSSFRTGPQTTLVALKVVRSPGDSHIQGTAWIDDVTLVQPYAASN